jgi:FemAB-related protein (PEP-CTERM system-associated)
MTAIRELTDADQKLWDQFVERIPEGSFFHRAGWREVIEGGFGHRAHYLLAERDGRITGVLPLIHLRSRLFANALISTAFCVGGGPLAEDEPTRAALDQAALGLADRLDVDFLEYRAPPPIAPGWRSRSDLYCGFARQIEADPERNLLAIPRKQRAEVRKGIKLGLAGTLDQDVSRFYDLFAGNVRHHGTPVFGKRYFRLLKDVFGQDCEVLIVTRDGRPVSGLMSFYFRDRVLPYYAGSGPDSSALCGHEFMYWDVMRRAGERGLHWFDFGRSKVGTGSFDFKKNWGFTPEPLTYGYHLRRGDQLPEFNPANPRYRMFIALWRHLPLGLSKIMGPWIARSLG